MTERVLSERNWFERSIENGHSNFKNMDMDDAWEVWVICLVTHSAENEPTRDLVESVPWLRSTEDQTK